MDFLNNSNKPELNTDHIPLEMSDRIISMELDNYPSHSDTNIENESQKNEIEVDFVLAYVDNSNSVFARKREIFEKSLLDQGLHLEYEQNRQLGFVKIHASKEVLCRYSEIMKLRMPIKPLPDEQTVEETDLFDDAKSWFIKLFSFAQLDPSKFPPKDYQLAAEYSRDKDYLFDTESKNFFTTHIRVMIVDFILERQCEGIQRLLATGVYSAAYPLHDGTTKQKGSTRALLYEEWGATSKWIKLQPLDTIREYFGTNFAMYFAWLGFYTYMLIPASIAGLLCFFYGLLTMDTNQLAKEACSPWAERVIMCPQCDSTCDYWRLNETCFITRMTHLFDNSAIVYFAAFMTVWSVLYLELWKRRAAALSYRWGLVGWDRTAEHSRPQYLSALSNMKSLNIKIKEKINPVTRVKEPYVSFWKVRVPATFFSFSVVILLISTALATVFAVVLYRMAKSTTVSLLGNEFDSTNYRTFVLPAYSAGINLVCILILNYIYDWLAIYLTEMELLRTQAEFDDSLTLKIYLFQFINYYASIFYVAFLKGKFVGYPKKYNKVFGFRQEECAPGGCLTELSIQLATIMVGKQTVYTVMEMIFPILYKYWALFRIHTGLKQKDPIAPRSQWIRDLKLLDWSPRGLYDEYLEMVIQFGFITLFVVAFPLAPFFALANNIFEMRLDATKFLLHYRRPVPRRARDIGIWQRILDSLARVSVITNGFIIAFSSTFIPRMVYRSVVSPNGTDSGFLNHSLAVFNVSHFPEGSKPTYSNLFENITLCRYTEYRNPPDHIDMPYKRPTIYWHILAFRLAFVVVFQNFVGLITMGVQWCLSGIPRKLRDQVKREAFLTEELIIKCEAERAKSKLNTNNQLIDENYDNLRRRSNYVSED